jgi:2-methylcitrate dehydratase PrpD
MIRVAWAGLPVLMEYRHHHTPVAVGPFGAAMAVSKLLGFDQEHTLNSLAIAGSHSGGLMEYTQSGGSVKRIHTGLAAKAGIRSAYFARAGLTGPRAVLEGNRGFLEGFADRDNTGRLVDALGEDYLIEGVGLKKYFAMYRIHPPLRALERVLADHGIEFGDIASIRVGVSSVTVTATGTIVEPEDAVGAQFSMRFALALAAKRGAGALKLVDDDMLHDPEVIALAHRVEVYVDPRLEERKWNSFATVLALSTSRGDTFVAEEEAPIGSPGNPMSDAEIEEKFRSLAEPVIGAGQCDQIIKAVWNLENIDVEADLMRHVTRPAGG